MKKQGFTLIELKVVIVIMGILAAVAVPKLFGLIAKSKASEVGPAAGTYVKLQDAYFSEQNKYGGWGLIGYTAPGSEGSSTSYKGTTFTYTAEALQWNSETTADTEKAWQAKNTETDLNDCKKNSTWTIKLLTTATTNVTGYTTAVTAVSGGNANCEVLTPSFTKIGK